MNPVLQQAEKPATAGVTPSAADDGIVSVSLQSLLALQHAAESVTLKPRRIRAVQSGSYLSSFKGRGMEFDEVRPYMQGDDVRMLDWRVMARTGHAHTKLFREERERAVLLWTDMRRSMHFATRGAYKSVRAAQAAAILGWSASAQGDRLGALIFTEDEHVELRPKSGTPPMLHFLRKLSELSQRPIHSPAPASSSQNSSMNQALTRLRKVAQPGSLIILLSDFDGLDAQSEAHLAQLARHSQLILIEIHDPLEAELPPAGNYRVSDGDHFISLATGESSLRQTYRQHFAAKQAQLQQFCRAHHMTLLPMTTAEQPEQILQRALGVRLGVRK